jgi:hypothetical protein
METYIIISAMTLTLGVVSSRDDRRAISLEGLKKQVKQCNLAV